MNTNPFPGIQSLVLLFFMLMITSVTSAQKTVTILHLASGDLPVKDNMVESRINDEFKKARFSGVSYCVLAFDKPISPTQQQNLKAAGVELLDYFPDNCYQVKMKQLPRLSGLYQQGVRSVFTLPGNVKMSKELNEQIKITENESPVLLSIQLQKDVKWEDVQSLFTFYGATLTKSDYLNQGLAQISIAANKVSALSELPVVAFLNISHFKSEPLNQRERGMFGLTNLSSSQGAGRNLTGSGVAIGIGDNANPMHLDLTKNVINRNPSSITNNHGKMVAGTVGGDGIIEEKYAGVAPNSLLVTDFFDYILTKSSIYYSDFNIAVTNNSYYTGLAGCPGNSIYNELSAYVDEQMYSNPFLQHIFAAGNDGGLTCLNFPSSFRTIKSGYQVGKNVLDVGNYDIGTDYLNAGSSRGPVADGRIKPEIIASGSQVTTTYYNNTYSNGWGTSHSAPLVTGVWALLTERYKQLHANAYPKAALLKAVICNTGDDKGNAGPDYSWGFGLINPRKAVEAIEQNHYYSAIATTGSVNSQPITVPAGTSKIKVMVYWHDKEASPLAAKALVNDLDITVTDGATIYQPWILDPTSAEVNNSATRGTDRFNNIEQVTIDNPGSSVTITINGFNVPAGPQEYFVTYEFLPADIHLEFPYGGERFSPSQTEIIRWNAYDNSSNSFTIEFSADDGATWSIIDNNIPSTTNRYYWNIPSTPTNKGKIRVTRNGTGGTVSMISPGNFTILLQPTLTATVPCEGYADLSWNAISGATDYEVMQVMNDELVSVATTTFTSYRINGLNKLQSYWFTVRARMTDSLGMRATAKNIVPSYATPCSATDFNNDLKIDALVTPLNGRKNTSTQLSSTQQITARIKNLDDAATSGTYTVSYQINGGAIISEIVSVSIAAGGAVDYTFTTPADLSAPGTYSIKLTVKQPGDLQTANDEQTFTIRHANNPAVTLPFTEGFESTGIDEYKASEFAIANADRFDFSTANTNGRLRTFVNTGMTITGNRSAVLDATNLTGLASNNQLTGTINLSNYAASGNLRFDFRFKNSGQFNNPSTGVWMRGSDASPWVQIYDLTVNQGNLGETKQVTYNISDLSQPITSSFQVRFDEQGLSSANNATYSEDASDMDDGFWFDDIHIAEANNDAILTAITAPTRVDCSTGNKAITIKVKNTTASAMTNVPVTYRINNGTPVTETISSINANTELTYTFSALANFSTVRAYIIDTWVKNSGDDYAINDSITKNIVYITHSVSSFPYLERFETSNGGWFTDTLSYSSWRYGKPSKSIINRSANGSNGWYNTLNGGYKSNETSYLYSPCFNLSSLTQPVLSFSHILQQEDNCDCDNSALEYSTDNGATWQRLTATNATNWFDITANQTWRASKKYWHVASTEVPNAANIRFRFLLSSDPGTEYEGVGIDDIHIFEKKTIYTGGQASSTQTVNNSNWIDFSSGGNIIASINPLGQDLGSTDISVYFNPSATVRNNSNQYYLDRNIVIRPANIPTDSVLVRFYFTHAEALALIQATGCGNCTSIKDAYLAGITKFSGNVSNENGTLADNLAGVYTFIPPENVDVVPFNNGYYAEFKVKSFSEFWINGGGINTNQPLPLNLLSFEGKKNNATVDLQWKTTGEENASHFEIERSAGSATSFVSIGSVAALNQPGNHTYKYTDVSALANARQLYYRLKMADKDGKYTYSNIVTITNDRQSHFIKGVYKNADRSLLVVTGNEAGVQKMNIRIINNNGAEVYSKSGPYETTSISLQTLAAGIYMVEIKDPAGGNRFVQKIQFVSIK